MRGVKKIGVRLGNWLLPDQAIALLEALDDETLKGKRDLAMLAILVACGLRWYEAVEILCNPPHNISSVAQSIMWRWDAISVMELDGDFPTPHNCLRVS